MIVRDLIAQLQTVDPTAEVFVWVDGDRYPLSTEAVDPWTKGIVDITAIVDQPVE